MLDQLETKLNGIEGDWNGNLTTKNKDAKQNGNKWSLPPGSKI